MTKKKPVKVLVAGNEDWEIYTTSTSWDIADALRTSATNSYPGADVKMTSLNGTYSIFIRRNRDEPRRLSTRRR